MQGRKPREGRDRLELCCHKARDIGSHETLEEVRESSPLDFVEGSQPC